MRRGPRVALRLIVAHPNRQTREPLDRLQKVRIHFEIIGQSQPRGQSRHARLGPLHLLLQQRDRRRDELLVLENAAQLLFGPQRRNYTNPDILPRGAGWTIPVAGSDVIITYTGVFSFVLSILLMIALYMLVYHTHLGKAMRAVAQDKKTAALMGIDVDAVISRTFIISGLLAGAALPAKAATYNTIESMIRHFKHIMDGIRVPPGESYTFVEGGNGELGFYIVSDGGRTPYRLHFRRPCFIYYQAYPEMIKGSMLSDAIITMSSMNVIAGELDA